MGCLPGFRMTANPRYFLVPADNPGGTYDFRGLAILNTVNVSQPQWICLKGGQCRSGFFSAKISGQDTCSWCGSGCASCTSFNNCRRCFSGFRLNPHTLPGSDRTVVTCSHSQVPCQVPARDHCFHDEYVAVGIGCSGCQSCTPGFIVTSNPLYMNRTSAAHNGTFDYQGLPIRQGVDVHEPRYVCRRGDTCQDGWYPALLDTTVICAECSVGCAQCSTRTDCSTCKDGFITKKEEVANVVTCSASVL